MDIVIGPTPPGDYRRSLPQVPWSDVRVRYQYNYYDGILSGVLIYGGRPCWFEAVDPEGFERRRVDDEGIAHDDWYRAFLIVALTDDQHAELVRRSELFREKVGTHWDYDEEGSRAPGALRPAETHHEFYDAAERWPPVDLSDSAIIGWTERIMDTNVVRDGDDDASPDDAV